jgi:hypothetical protein
MLVTTRTGGTSVRSIKTGDARLARAARRQERLLITAVGGKR